MGLMKRKTAPPDVMDQPGPKPKKPLNILLIGPAGCGKSQLLNMYTNHIFVSYHQRDYRPVHYRIKYAKDIPRLQNTEYTEVFIIDIPGDENLERPIDLWGATASVAMLCFDLSPETLIESLKKALAFRAKIEEKLTNRAGSPFILVGCKKENLNGMMMKAEEKAFAKYNELLEQCRDGTSEHKEELDRALAEAEQELAGKKAKLVDAMISTVNSLAPGIPFVTCSAKMHFGPRIGAVNWPWDYTAPYPERSESKSGVEDAFHAALDQVIGSWSSTAPKAGLNKSQRASTF